MCKIMQVKDGNCVESISIRKRESFFFSKLFYNEMPVLNESLPMMMVIRTANNDVYINYKGIAAVLMCRFLLNHSILHQGLLLALPCPAC